jgi:hypothetical protein
MVEHNYNILSQTTFFLIEYLIIESLMIYDK